MQRKQIDKIMVNFKTYNVSATEACRRRFARHLKRTTQLEGEPPMDHYVRLAWHWFWLGWFRQ